MKLRGKKELGEQGGVDLVKSYYMQAQNTQTIKKPFKKMKRKPCSVVSREITENQHPLCSAVPRMILLLNSCREMRVE